MSKKLRVGLIRCDTHGAYYATLMNDHNPLQLQSPVALDAPAHYSWERGGVHFYFYTDYGDPTNMTVDFVDGFELVKVWDEHPSAAANLCAVCRNQPVVCNTFDQVSDDVDLVFVADCNGDGSDHLELARPGLEKGVATFVDKPTARDTASVRELVQLSRRHKALLTSVSILRALPVAAQFARRLDEVGGLEFAAIQGGGTSMAGHIHAACLSLHLFGHGVQEVRCMGETELQMVHLSYGDRPDRPRRGVALHCDVGSVWHCAFHASAYGPAGAIHSPAMSDFDFPFGAAAILRSVREMVQTGRPPSNFGDIYEGVAICEAARLAQKRGGLVRIQELGENPCM